MILEPGTKVLVAHRRLFAGDSGRFFVGVVEAYEAGMARVTGRSWLKDSYHGTYVRKEDTRTKVLSIASGTVIVYQLPSTVNLNALKLHFEGSSLSMRDGMGFKMDLTESVHRGIESGSELGRPA